MSGETVALGVNHIINTVAALAIAMAPQLVNKFAIGDMNNMYADAKKHAERMIETGDTSELDELGEMMDKMDAYKSKVKGLDPAIDKAVRQMAPLLPPGLAPALEKITAQK